jgi:hypothetical protein
MSKDLKDDENKSEEKPHKSYNLISSLIHPHPSNILSITSRLPQYNLLPYSPFQLDPLGKNFYFFPRFLPSPNVEIKKKEIPKNKEDDIKDDIKILKEQVKSLIEEKNIDKKETNKKMNEFQQKIEGQINSLKLQIELQFNQISSMIKNEISDLRKSQEQKYDILAKKIDDIDGKISNLERRVEKLEKNSKKIKMGIIKIFSELDE